VALLVRAAREQSNQNHQVRQGKQPLVSLRASRFRSARDHSKMTALREIVYMLHADAGQAGYFRIGEYFLARFDGYHGLPHVLSIFRRHSTFVMLSVG